MDQTRMQRPTGRWVVLHAAGFAAGILAWLASSAVFPNETNSSAEGPFGYTLLRTADGGTADVEAFFLDKDCAVCHPRQLRELQGSMHTAAHTDPLYRSFAEAALREAGPKVYAYCSGCHSAAGVSSGSIPGKHDADIPAEARAGVTCDVCHSITSLSGDSGPWKEPGNASFVLEQSRNKFGSLGQVTPNRRHTGKRRDFFSKSEYCASCHTVIHPVNGMRIEHTYGEWKASIYAQKGIQCQDCHLRTVANAVQVAETLRPVIVEGQSATEGPQRRIAPHFFVGGNANADVLAGGQQHAAMAEERLKSAARVELKLPQRASAGKPMSFDVLVHNVAAGHNIPTGVTELRQMWLVLQVVDSRGHIVYRSGELDERGELRPGAIRFGAEAADKNGKKTYKLWEMSRFLAKRTIPPKGFTRDTVTVEVPANLSGELTVKARLRYRSVAPLVAKEFMGNRAFTPKIIEMAETTGTIRVP